MKRFTIDVEENTQENAVFLDDKFICFEDDYDKLLEYLNCLYEEKEKMQKDSYSTLNIMDYRITQLQVKMDKIRKDNIKLTEEVMILRRKEMSLDEILQYNDEYFLDGEWGNFALHHIRLGSDNHIITPTMVVDRLNKLSKLNKKVIEDNIGLQKENHELEKQLHELIDYVNELIEENQALKQSDNITDLETQIMKLKEENENLKQALWEAEVNYYGERCDNVLDYESWIEDLKEEWDKEYWND